MTRSPSPGVVAAVLAFGCAAPRPADPAILTLGEHEVRRSEFETHLRKLEGQGGGPLDPDVRQALLGRFLEERLLVLEARRRGALSPAATEAEEHAAVRAMLAAEVLSPSAIGDDALRGYYAEHGSEFHLPERRSVRQILVATENEARDLRRRLQRDPRAFELLARSRSRAPEAAQGGLMGTFAAGELPAELEAAVVALRPGAISAVVATPLGYHVLRVDAQEPARQRNFEECRDEIRARLLQRRSETGVRQFVRALMARAKVNHDAATADLPVR